jgi:hypothetical protein
MRNMSFALTTQQVQDMTKDVTRRMGWLQLKPGNAFQPVKKCMGLRPGEKIERIGGAVVTVSTCREPLRRLIDEPEYGRAECRREGFPEMSPAEFVTMFCESHRGCTPETTVTRIEFSYGEQQ